VSGLFTSQFGRGSYQNEIMIILMMSMYLVPLGTFVVYKLIMTVIHNIRAIGFFGGIGMLILQFIATFTVIYVFAIVVGGALVGSLAITKKLMNE
jgi:hypothetical protein